MRPLFARLWRATLALAVILAVPRPADAQTPPDTVCLTVGGVAVHCVPRIVRVDTVYQTPPAVSITLTSTDSVLRVRPATPYNVFVTAKVDSAGAQLSDSATFTLSDPSAAKLFWLKATRRLQLYDATAGYTGVVTLTARYGTASASLTIRIDGDTGSSAPPPPPPPPPATGVAELPRAVPTLPAGIESRPCTTRPTTSAALQQALNAGGSQVICLPMGTTYIGEFDVPARAVSDTGWSVLRADASFTFGQRITGSENLPILAVADIRFPGLFFHSRAARWFVQGIRVTPNDAAALQGPMALIEVGERISERTLADLPREIHFSHMDLRGNPLQNVRRGFMLNGAGHIVRDSRCTEIHERNSDSQCTLSYNGPGPFLIENNLLEAASENIMWGGGDPGIPGLVPCDITVRGNLIRKPISWKSVGTPTQSGSYLVKLLYEAKNSCRALVENNRMDGSWLDGQTGYAIGLKSVNQSGGCRWCRVTDQTFRNNTIVNTGAVLGLAGRPEAQPVDTALSRVLFTGNWFDSTNVAPFVGDARGILAGWQAVSLHFIRNTWAGGNWNRDAIIFDIGSMRPAVTDFRFEDNVMPIGQYGVGATGAGGGTTALNAATVGWTFTNNTFIGAPRSGYPATTRWAPDLASALATGAGIPARPVP